MLGPRLTIKAKQCGIHKLYFDSLHLYSIHHIVSKVRVSRCDILANQYRHLIIDLVLANCFSHLVFLGDQSIINSIISQTLLSSNQQRFDLINFAL